MGLVVAGRSPLGTKERLREAIDTRVTDAFAQLIEQLADTDLQDGQCTSIAAAFQDQVGADSAVLAYLRRLLIDGGAAANALFDRLYAATQRMMASLESAGVIRPTADAPARAGFC